MIDNRLEMCQRARTSLKQCRSKFESSCYGYMRTYNNGFVHKLLNRNRAVELLSEWLIQPQF